VGMRRLLASVASVAALLMAPAAALATTQPVVSSPASPFGTTTPSVPLVWGSVGVAVTYRVLRSVMPVSGVCDVTAPGSAAEAMPATLDATNFTDDLTVPGEGRYCYWVEAADPLSPPEADSSPLAVTYDATVPGVPVVTQTGGNGCAAFTLVSATAPDNLGPVAVTTAGPFPYSPPGTPGQLVSAVVTATDSVGNATSVTVTGNVLDPDRPPAPVLEVVTDPSQQKATLSWDFVTADGLPVTGYNVRTKGPTGPPLVPVAAGVNSLVFSGLDVDATYEYSLTAADACGESTASVRLVRLNDATAPSAPILANPAFISASKAVTLSWVPSADNIQVDHYQIFRDGIPLAVTDASVFTDATPGEHVHRTYVVRAIDTNGNTAESDPKSVDTPDWTPPTAPVPQVTAFGRTVTLRWTPAADNVGVVGYDVLRDGKVIASQTAGLRTYPDRDVPVGPHAWIVRARDDAKNARDSVPVSLTVKKLPARAIVIGLKLARGSHGGAARYSLAGSDRLLLDVRVVGTLPKAALRVYVQSGKGRITVWRGTPGSSSPRQRLHSSLTRHGFVTIHLGRTLHAGHTRLVLIASDRMVIVGSGKHKPSIRAG
jgi:hypothetical protein